MTKTLDHSPFDILLPSTLAHDLLNCMDESDPEKVEAFIDGILCGFAIACKVADGSHKLDMVGTAAEIMRGYTLAQEMGGSDD